MNQEVKIPQDFSSIESLLCENLSNEDYHNIPGISRSAVMLINDCPRRYWFEYLSGLAPELDPTSVKAKNYAFGEALHTIVLEPDTFHQRFFVADDYKRTTKEGKEYHEFVLSECLKTNRKLINKEYFLQIQNMRDLLLNNENIFIDKMVNQFKSGGIEHSFLWRDEDTGVLLKARPDFYNDYLIVDLKTTANSNPDYFLRNCVRQYGYDIQAAMLIDGYSKVFNKEPIPVVFLPVEKEEPYLTGRYVIPMNMIEEGRQKYKKAALTYSKCMKENKWPGYFEGIQELNWYS